MIKNIKSFEFPGFYNSCYSDPDDFFYEKKELEDSLRTILGKKIDVEIDYIDFDKYKLDISKEFLQIYVEKIKDILPYDITDKEEFKFEIIKDSTTVFSPKYYNNYTDECQCMIETNYQTLNDIKNYALQITEAKEYIKKEYTSNEAEGFVSFLPNNIEDWKIDIKDMEERMFSALLDMLIALDDEDNFGNINVDVLNNIYKYEYAAPPVLTYNGKTYKVDE